MQLDLLLSFVFVGMKDEVKKWWLFG